MEKTPCINSQWVIITDGTNIFDSEFRFGALELAHERGFHNIRLMRDESIMDKYLEKFEACNKIMTTLETNCNSYYILIIKYSFTSAKRTTKTPNNYF